VRRKERNETKEDSGVLSTVEHGNSSIECLLAQLFDGLFYEKLTVEY
jgi:hypothetical protein